MPHGEPDPLTHLEPDQLRVDRTRPLAPARLPRLGSAGLWAMRVGAIVLSVMVLYTFIAGLAH